MYASNVYEGTVHDDVLSCAIDAYDQAKTRIPTIAPNLKNGIKKQGPVETNCDFAASSYFHYHIYTPLAQSWCKSHCDLLLFSSFAGIPGLISDTSHTMGWRK